MGISYIKYFFICITVSSLLSCSFTASWIPPSDINTEEEIFTFMREVRYIANPSIDMDTAQEVYERMSGDCDGMAHLMASFYKYNMGAENVEMIGCTFHGYPHMILCVDGIYYDGSTVYQIEDISRYKLLIRMSYEAYEKLASIK